MTNLLQNYHKNYLYTSFQYLNIPSQHSCNIAFINKNSTKLSSTHKFPQKVDFKNEMNKFCVACRTNISLIANSK